MSAQTVSAAVASSKPSSTEATGQPPGDWLIAERVAEAQRLLEASALSVERIAAEAGFGSVQALCHHFQARLGLAPRAYRASFGGTGEA